MPEEAWESWGSQLLWQMECYHGAEQHSLHTYGFLRKEQGLWPQQEQPTTVWEHKNSNLKFSSLSPALCQPPCPSPSLIKAAQGWSQPEKIFLTQKTKINSDVKCFLALSLLHLNLEQGP